MEGQPTHSIHDPERLELSHVLVEACGGVVGGGQDFLGGAESHVDRVVHVVVEEEALAAGADEAREIG